MLHKIFSQNIYKLFFATTDAKYTYEVVVERNVKYSDTSVPFDNFCTVHVEIKDTITKFKRNFDYICKHFSRSEMLRRANTYFNQFGLIPNPRLSFVKDEIL